MVALTPCRTRGMTLVELLVVVVILLLLSVMTIPRLMPTDVQKARDAALTVTSMTSRVLRRAEQNGKGSNGVRTAGLWLEPLDSLSGGAGKSRGVSELFACEPQDPYRGDDPEAAKVFVHHAFDANDPAALRAQALLLFSTQTSPNVREFARSASRITFSSDPRSYYFRLLTAAEQAAWAANNPTRLPRPYRPSETQNNRQQGFYRTKQLTGNGQSYFPFDGGPEVAGAGDIFLAIVKAIPPDGSPPRQSGPAFEAGQPPGALYTSSSPCNSPPPTDTPGGCGCIQRQVEDYEEGKPIYTMQDGRFVCVPQHYQLPSQYPASDIGTSFTIQRPITRSATPPVSLPAGYGIDVAWSSFGDRLLVQPDAIRDSNFVPFPGVGGMTGIEGMLSNRPVMVMFSMAGAVESLVFHRLVIVGGSFSSTVEDRITDAVDVYLLVGRLDRAGQPYIPAPNEQNPGANWQYPDSRWLRISKTNGEMLISEPVLGAPDVKSSQQYARLGISASRN